MKIFLGIHVGHNASAALMINGKIKFALQEERFNNIKNFTGFPENSLNYINRFIKIHNLKIDTAAFGTISSQTFELKYPINHHFTIKEFDEYYGEKFYSKKIKGLSVRSFIDNLKNDKRFKKKNVFSSIKNNSLFEEKINYQKFSKNKLIKIFKKRIKNILFLDHHTCHAYYGKFSIDAREKNYAVIVIDSIGDGINQSIWLSGQKNNQLTSIVRNNQCELGRIYKFTTLIMNMKPDEHEFKVMGMAPYAKEYYTKKIYNDVFKKILKFNDLKIVHNKRPKDLYLFLKNQLKHERFDNIAGAVQLYLENVIGKLLLKIYKKYKIKKFFFSGGVSMNVKMYNTLIKNNFISKIYNAPSGSDDSLSIGACYYLNRNNKTYPLENLYLGLPLIENRKFLKKIIKTKFKKKYSISFNATPRIIAKLLKKNNIIAIANENEEFGARALGNRSIIANPSNPENVKQINEFIKNRDFWMPFALSINSKSTNKYLVNPKKLESDYMNLSFDINKKYYDIIKAGCHPYDRTVRPQFVKKKHNPAFYRIIQEFNKITKINAVLNTSLNLHGFPKCGNLKDVINTFKKSGLKYLYINQNILIKKN